MLIIWRGLGCLTPIVAIVVFVGTQLIVDAIFGKGSYTERSNIYGSLALVISGIALWVIGSRINQPRVINHPQLGPVKQEGGQHTFFFIPVEYWGILALGGAAAVFVAGLL
jgi:hypothetical protein